MPIDGQMTGSHGDGARVGWFIGEQDGLPRRLPIDIGARDRYQRGVSRQQRLIWVEEAGSWDTEGQVIRMPGTNMVRQIPLEDKYTQLNRLCDEANPDGSYRFPMLRDARLRLLSGTRSSIAVSATCGCGLTFTNAQFFALHQQVCSAVAAATGASAPSGGGTGMGPPAVAGAPVAKPPKPFTCRKCDPPIVFPSQSECSAHQYATHRRRDINGRYMEKSVPA